MKFDPALLRTMANTSGFPPDNLEKLVRLRELLTEFYKHPSLRNRLVLKGGTKTTGSVEPIPLSEYACDVLRAWKRETGSKG